jgi:hypothetical protein
MESNPLGMALPSVLEQPLNTWTRRYLPSLFATLEKNLQQEQQAQLQGIQKELAH